jgi:hypothetical protein
MARHLLAFNLYIRFSVDGMFIAHIKHGIVRKEHPSALILILEDTIYGYVAK